MKMKKLSLIICSVLMIFMIVSCVEDSHADNDGDGYCDTCHENLKLASVEVTISEDGVASWQEVKNATSYIYKIDGKEMATKKTSIQLQDGQTIQVKAVATAPYVDSDYSTEQTYTAPVQIKVGLPELEEGFYMRDADVLQDGTTRYLVYTTNKTKSTEDSVIAIRTGELTEEGYVYGEQTIILEAGDTWDQYLGSASLTKGTFSLDGQTYNYLLAYQGTKSSQGVANQIGFAVAQEITGPYVKVGENPVITYDASVYGANMMGCYAPSLVNYNKESGIRVFYTLADAYGHYAYFMDFDLSDLSNIHGVKAMITNEGDLQGGDAVTMFPNADYAYDDVNRVFYAVKDVSPSPSIKPSFADEFELCHLAEDELYTTDKGEGWVSDTHQDYFDLECDRVYSACIVSDMYGHMLDGDIVIIYNNCSIGNDYMFTQYLVEYIYSR